MCGGSALWCADADPAYSLRDEPVCQGNGWAHNVYEDPDDVNQPSDDLPIPPTAVPQATRPATQATRALAAVAKKATRLFTQHALMQPKPSE